MNFTLQEAVTKAATFSGTPLVLTGQGRTRLKQSRSLIITLDITVAERDTANETYDFYITSSDGLSTWDICHFPQIATTGAKRFTARINCEGLLQTVTTAAPGVIAVESGTLATISGGTNAILSLGAGLVRHGAIGDQLSHELVVAGTVVTGIAYSIQVQIE